MTSSPTSPITDLLEDPWQAFIDATIEFRPELFSFGMKLTGNPFDGEDLVQDALIRGFGSAAFQDGGVTNWRSYLFRVMANLWIDQQRRARAILSDHIEETPSTPDADRTELREAAGILFDELRPRERTALVLHEAMGFSHAEIADLLTTSEGAVRTALYRARGRLDDRIRERRPRIEGEVVDRFVAAFTAADLGALRSLLVDDVEATVFPAGRGRGADHAIADGWIRGSLYHHDAQCEASERPYPSRLTTMIVAGETVVLVERVGDGDDEMLLEEVWRFEGEDGQITRVQDYCFCPDLVTWVGERAALPTRSAGYQFGVVIGS